MSDQFHQHSFKVPKTARFYSTGSITSATKNVWLVLHGYGQLVPFFIRHFKSIASDETVIVAPEGLSRFYLEGTGGRVGATWMTKEDRLDDIDDYEQYLDLVCRELEQLYSISLSDKNLTLLGFSQGGATATRWLNHTSVAVDQFVMWCSVFPPDMPADI